jgi:hypothetical protein
VSPGGSYPLGKARNEVVEGDGSGTPLEEQWVNDLWGFLQALLAGASITASGNPDQVGASQYVDAIQALIYDLLDYAHTWQAAQTFNAQARFNTGLEFGPSADGVSYVTPPTRKVMVPIVPYTALNWLPSTTPVWVTTAGDPLSIIVGRDLLPSGAVLLNVRACVNTSDDVTLTVRQFTYDTSTTNAPVTGTSYTDSFSPAGTEAHTLVANFPADTYHYNDSVVGVPTQLQISVEAANVGASCTLRWIEIEYLDQVLWNI